MIPISLEDAIGASWDMLLSKIWIAFSNGSFILADPYTQEFQFFETTNVEQKQMVSFFLDSSSGSPNWIAKSNNSEGSWSIYSWMGLGRGKRLTTLRELGNYTSLPYSLFSVSGASFLPPFDPTEKPDKHCTSLFTWQCETESRWIALGFVCFLMFWVALVLFVCYRRYERGKRPYTLKGSGHIEGGTELRLLSVEAEEGFVQIPGNGHLIEESESTEVVVPDEPSNQEPVHEIPLSDENK
jgi:hypothetical protein